MTHVYSFSKSSYELILLFFNSFGFYSVHHNFGIGDDNSCCGCVTEVRHYTLNMLVFTSKRDLGFDAAQWLVLYPQILIAYVKYLPLDSSNPIHPASK